MKLVQETMNGVSGVHHLCHTGHTLGKEDCVLQIALRQSIKTVNILCLFLTCQIIRSNITVQPCLLAATHSGGWCILKTGCGSPFPLSTSTRARILVMEDIIYTI